MVEGHQTTLIRRIVRTKHVVEKIHPSFSDELNSLGPKVFRSKVEQKDGFKAQNLL